MKRSFVASLLAACALAPAALAGCAGSAHQPPVLPSTGLIINPSSSENSPISLTNPNASVTLTASESGHTAFSASIFTGEHCVNLDRVSGSTNQFVVTRIFGCNRVLIKIVDDRGNDAPVFLVTQ